MLYEYQFIKYGGCPCKTETVISLPLTTNGSKTTSKVVWGTTNDVVQGLGIHPKGYKRTKGEQIADMYYKSPDFDVSRVHNASADLRAHPRGLHNRGRLPRAKSNWQNFVQHNYESLLLFQKLY